MKVKRLQALRFRIQFKRSQRSERKHGLIYRPSHHYGGEFGQLMGFNPYAWKLIDKGLWTVEWVTELTPVGEIIPRHRKVGIYN